MSSPRPPDPAPGLKLFAAAALAVSAVGFFTGTRPVALPPVPVAPQQTKWQAAPMPTYRALRSTPRGLNAEVPAQEFTRLGQEVRSVSLAASSVAAAVGARRERRAYDGAPPTIPHPVNQQLVPACLACHEKGAVVDGRLARAMSHARTENCLQCHVVALDPRPVGARGGPPLTSNAFVGLFDDRGGSRAWRGAPPTVPHPPDMRGTCESCHGPAGEAGLRSSHPERASCLQCHALNFAAQQAFPRAQGVLPPSERAFP